MPVLSTVDEHSSHQVSGTLIGRGTLLPWGVGERTVLAVLLCVQEQEAMWKRPNGLIGVSGNGRYLTRDISQSWMKRLEAEGEGEGGREGNYAVC